MNAQELVEAGQLSDAIRVQTEEVKAQPTDADARFLLFTLLAFAGELERAERQLDAIAHQQPHLSPGAVTYRALLAAEMARREVHAGRQRPLLPDDPERDIEDRVTAFVHLASGDQHDLARTLERAAGASVAVSGKLDGRGFSALRDYDDLLATVIEVFAGGRYLWVPLTRLVRLQVREPATTLDLLWVPAHLEDSSGNTADVHLPVLYGGSHTHENDLVRLGRQTEWIDCGGGVAYRGAGQRTFLVAEEGEEREVPLLSIRNLEVADTGPAEGGTRAPDPKGS